MSTADLPPAPSRPAGSAASGPAGAGRGPGHSRRFSPGAPRAAAPGRRPARPGPVHRRLLQRLGAARPRAPPGAGRDLGPGAAAALPPRRQPLELPGHPGPRELPALRLRLQGGGPRLAAPGADLHGPRHDLHRPRAAAGDPAGNGGDRGGARPRPGDRLLPRGDELPGETVAPFKPSLLELPVRLGRPVHHATLGYRTPPGEPPADETVCYWGNVPFARHALGILGLRSVLASVHLDPEPITETDRKLLAERLREAILASFEPVPPIGQSALWKISASLATRPTDTKVTVWSSPSAREYSQSPVSCRV